MKVEYFISYSYFCDSFFLSACGGLRAESYQSSDSSVTSLSSKSPGTSNVVLADRLNTRHLSTLEHCAQGSAALACSGVILRNSTFSAGFDFWTHSPASQRLGSVSFSYIRSDFPSNQEDIHSGFIFMGDQQAAVAGKMRQIARCIYPFVAGRKLVIGRCMVADSRRVRQLSMRRGTKVAVLRWLYPL